ncbi:CAMK protein kinase [Saprolegnia diclina VS20]|uniref:CAMK protein kinase n=1 Tax=Saprolegnia diclina (strain VS20) TaxID=1156394 RepID=T0Q4Z2_SAPDV|nr:CAMK protein kinase [Saprolegnia diclina VS20]EQC29686.1 CAMK protein kinase [Saprolegnia diclina VS20]|eukprot:XP_008616990.1 CAMK protein kinase [Saprolegnia diclina VS20]
MSAAGDGEQRAGVAVKDLPRADLAFAAKYEMGDVVPGRSSAVRRATERSSGKVVMVKRFDRTKLSKADMKELRKETSVLRKLAGHANVFGLHDFLYDTYEVYVVTDLIEGDDLFERIVKKEIYTEKEARDVIKTLLEAVAHCHAHGIAHCDLSPQNVLFTSKARDATLKLTSFGLAQEEGVDTFSVPCGLPTFIAPEVAKSLISYETAIYTKAIDVWAVGVIAYTILCGYLPFYNHTEWNLYKEISKGDFSFNDADWAAVSPSAQAFVARALVVDPQQRPTADALLQDAWVTASSVATTPLVNAKAELRQFNARRSFKAAIHTVQAALSLARIAEVADEDNQHSDA